MAKSHKHKRLLHWDNEVAFGNGHILTTSYGYAWEPDDDHNSACHVRGFDTVREARAELKWIKPCRCLRCTTQGHEARGNAETL